MNLKDIYDISKFRLLVEANKRGDKRIKLSPRELAYLISAGQMDIQKQVKVIQLSTDIELVQGKNVYVLPDNYGIFRSAVINEQNLVYKPLKQMIEYDDAEGMPRYINVFALPEGKRMLIYPKPSQDATLRIDYYVDPNYFSASLLNFDDVIPPAPTTFTKVWDFEDNTLQGWYASLDSKPNVLTFTGDLE